MADNLPDLMQIPNVVLWQQISHGGGKLVIYR